MIEAERGGRVPGALRVVRTTKTEDIFSREEASQFKVALAAMAVAEQFINQEGEREFSLNMEFFSVFGKLTRLLPRGEAALVYVCNYEKAKEEALREFVMEGGEALRRTENSEDIMLRIWMEENIQNKSLLLENASKRFGDSYSTMDLRKHRNKVLEVFNGKYYSLHPELRGMMSDGEWERQEAQKKQAQQRRTGEPQKKEPIAVPAEFEPELPKKAPEEILKLEAWQTEKLTWTVRLFREGKKAELGDIKAARVRLLSKGFSVFYSRADEVAALFYDEAVEPLGRDLTFKEFRALKEISKRINKKEQRRAKKERKQ